MHRIAIVCSLFTLACSATHEASCTTDADCEEGRACVDATCTPRGPGIDAGSIDAGPVACEPARTCGELCCAEGERCGGGLCCPAAELCDGVCCGPDARCESDRCVLDCGERAACGGGADERCCDGGDVCYLGACTTPGAMCSELEPCPEAQYCDRELLRCLPRAMGEACEVTPPVGTFSPAPRWHWTGDPTILPLHNRVVTAAFVMDLVADPARDPGVPVAEVVFHSHPNQATAEHITNAVLRAIAGDDGRPVWTGSEDGVPVRTNGASLIALGDVDASSPGPEVITCAATVPLAGGGWATAETLVFSASGELLRRVPEAQCWTSAPAIGDMDGDGVPEIAMRDVVFHADGTVLPGFVGTPAQPWQSDDEVPAMSDLDGDGNLELVLSLRVRRVDGTELWNRSDLGAGPAWPAIGDLDRDGDPEVVYVLNGSSTVVALDGATGATVWGPITIPGGGGGPPTIADVDGDGAPDVGTAGRTSLIALRGTDGAVLWSRTTRDSSGRTGSVVFDFDGDGVAEVCYSDEYDFQIYRGADGEPLFTDCNTNSTWLEYPVVANIDGDAAAEVLVVGDAYRTSCADGMGRVGVRAYADATGNWVRTRRVWNQHTYHVTNVDEDGAIPARERANWTVPNLNNFRQNVQPEGLLDAPDLVLTDLRVSTSACPVGLGPSVRVVNRGAASAPAAVPVTFYVVEAGVPTRIGRATTSRVLLPGESEVVTLAPPFEPPAGREADTFVFEALLNAPDDEPLATLRQCRTDNDRAGPVDGRCPQFM